MPAKTRTHFDQHSYHA